MWPILKVLLFVSLFLLVGCSGLNSNHSNGGGTPMPSFTPANIQGQYEVQVNSSTVPNNVSLIEVNFTQTDTDVFAAKGNVVIINGTMSGSNIQLQSVGGECDNGVLGNDSLQGTFSSATQASVTLTEAGALGTGTATGSVTFSSDGTKIVSGSYSMPTQCGFPSTSGTVIGVKISPFSGTYSGMLTSSSLGTNAFIVTVTQSGLTVNVSGTMNGTPFSMTGSVVGATFDVTGTIAGQSMGALGLYDVVNNVFLVYDNQGNYLGTLQAGSNPQAAVATRSFRLKPAEVLRMN